MSLLLLSLPINKKIIFIAQETYPRSHNQKMFRHIKHFLNKKLTMIKRWR